MRSHNYFVYITTNPLKTTLYLGVTNDLPRRMNEHTLNAGIATTFAGRYHCYNLVYFERHNNIENAIDREKEIKKWNRTKKNALINDFNKDWKFLNDEVSDS